jgi:signal peptidase I
MNEHHDPKAGPRLGSLTAALCGAVLISVLASVAWNLSGGRLLAMSSPSMCPTACIGSLVAIQPLAGPVHSGEMITFRPPGISGEFTHRVVAVEANGSFITKGDAQTSPDPWVVSPSEVIGRVSFTISGLGLWLRALPMVALGTLALLFARRFINLRNRLSFERLFGTMVVVLPVLRMHPLVSGQLIQAVPDPHRHGWFMGLVVNTGLLPAQIHVTGGTVLHHLAASHLAWVKGPGALGMELRIHESAALPLWGWGVVLAAVLSPIVSFLVYRLRSDVEIEGEGAPIHVEFMSVGHMLPAMAAPRSLEEAVDAVIAAAIEILARDGELQPTR